MINLSHKAAQRFGIRWKDLDDRRGDFWKLDVVMVGRVPMVFMVHEPTLFTLVRRKSQFRDLTAVAAEIRNACPWYRGPQTLTLGKNGNPRLTGSINEMKRMTTGFYSPEQKNAMEMDINQGLYSYLATDKEHYSKPFEAVEDYVKGRTPWLREWDDKRHGSPPSRG